MLDVIWVVLPVLGAFFVHAPVMRYDVLRALKVPLDGGATCRGRRVFGDNKTWRGALAMGGGVCALALLLSLWPGYWSRLPAEIRAAGPLVFGLLLGAGTVVGELPNSFMKRQLGIAPGTQRRSVGGMLLALYDQADFVPGIWLLLLPIWVMPVAQMAVAFAVVTAVHLVLNVVGWAMGARSVPI